MAEECITVGQYEDALLMDGCELRLNGCLRTLDHIIEVRQNLVGPEFLTCPSVLLSIRFVALNIEWKPFTVKSGLLVEMS
jgi:hypothetical protein